jgi:hypothetical protein
MPDETTTEKTAGAAQPQPAAAARPRRLGLGASIALLLVALITVGGLAFAAGRLTAPESAKESTSPLCQYYVYGRGGNQICVQSGDTDGVPGWMMPGMFPGGIDRGSYATVLTGTVTAVDSSGITIALPGGRRATIAVNRSTVYRVVGSAGSASLADVQVGSTVTVTVTGQRALTARSVVIRSTNT